MSGSADSPAVASQMPGLTRRAALLGAVTAGAVLPLMAARAVAAEKAKGEGEVLADLLALEQVAVVAYAHAAAAGVLGPELERAARRFEAHEQQQAGALAAALEELGGRRPPAPGGVADIAALAPGVAGARDRPALLRALVELEEGTVSAYHGAQRQLESGHLLQMTAAAMAADGQHLVVLRRAAGIEPAARPFETGRETGWSDYP